MSSQTKNSNAPDVLVIGGGLIGCAIALRLAQARLAVCVIDRGDPGKEASSAAAGMLAPQGEMVEPGAFFQLCMASRRLYPSFAAEVEELSGEKVGYRGDGNLLVAINQEECQELENTYRAQAPLGLPLERLSAEEVTKCVPGLSTEIRCGLFVSGDHWVDNERLTEALVKACRRLDVSFITGSAVTRLEREGDRVVSLQVAPQSGGAGDVTTVAADRFVLAAGCWSNALVAPLGVPLPMVPCRGQMIEFESPQDFPLVVRRSTHYLVPRAQRRIVAGTTTEYVGFEKAVTGEGLRSILEGAMRITPLVKQLRFRRAWSGLRPDTADHLPILGYGELDNLLFATGHFRNGILLAPITAQLISELLLAGSTSRPIEVYRPTRFARISSDSLTR